MPENGPFDNQPFAHAQRVYASWRTQPRWMHKAVAAVIFLILLGVAAFLLLWGLMVAAVLIAVTAVIVGARSLYRSFTGESAMRKSVRIVRR